MFLSNLPRVCDDSSRDDHQRATIAHDPISF